MSPKVTPQNANNPALQHGGGAAAASGLASTVTMPRSHPMVMRTRVGAGTGDGLQPQGPRPAASTGGVSKKRSVDDVASGSEAGPSQRQRVASPGSQGAGPATANVFSATEAELLKQADKVLVLEYSSTGGGHTARSLDPIMQAVKDGTLKKGDCVVLLAPPRWPHDEDGAKAGKLHAYKDKLTKEGIHVLVRQSNKTVTGHYNKDGSSNNTKMLLDLVNKPRESMQRVSLSNPKPQNGQISVGFGDTAKTILDGVLESGAKKENILVLGDMAPYLQKAAERLGIKNTVEIGNHQGLFIGGARTYLNAKGLNLAYLHKASGGGRAESLALVKFSSELNVVKDLKATFSAFNITASTTKKQAREIVAAHLLATAKTKSLDKTFTKEEAKTPGILVGKGVVRENSETVDSMVYLYVNDYTADLVEEIRKKLAAGEYANTIFTVCNAGSTTPERQTEISLLKSKMERLPKGAKKDEAEAEFEMEKAKDNILMASYAAGADGICSAGFGTTSEFYYLSTNGSDARLVVAPVENQHEQGANAADLKTLLGDKVRNTNDLGDGVVGPNDNKLAHQLFEMLDDPGREPDVEDSKTLGAVVAAAGKDATSAKQAADLLAGTPVRDPDSAAAISEAVSAMQDANKNHAPKQHRRLLKLVVPMIHELSKNPDASSAVVQATSKSDPHVQSLNGLKEILIQLGGPERNEAQDKNFIELMHLENNEGITVDDTTRQLATSLLEKLNQATEGGGTKEARAQRAQTALDEIATRMVMLGW